LLWLLLALTHVAFAIEATEPLAELNRTCGSNRDRAPDASGTFAQSAGADLWLRSPRVISRCWRTFRTLPLGLFARASLFPGSRIEAGPLGPYGPGDANKFERLAKGVSPFFAHWRGPLWITFLNQCAINNLRAKEIGLIQSDFAVH
jgi:hypothetical protein